MDFSEVPVETVLETVRAVCAPGRREARGYARTPESYMKDTDSGFLSFFRPKMSDDHDPSLVSE